MALPRVVRFFRNKANVADQPDLVQNTMIGLLEAHDRLADDGAFWPFVYGVSRNVLREYVRQRMRGHKEVSDFHGVCVRDLDPSVSSIVAARREGQAVVDALREVSLADQILLELRFFEDMEAREIADVIGIPRGSIHRELVRSVERLRDKVCERLRGLGSTEAEPSLELLEQWMADVRSTLQS